MVRICKQLRKHGNLISNFLSQIHLVELKVLNPKKYYQNSSQDEETGSICHGFTLRRKSQLLMGKSQPKNDFKIKNIKIEIILNVN